MSSEQAQVALRELLEGPAMRPPAGVISNFHNPPNLDVYVAWTLALCISISTLAVALRMYTKVFILRVLAWEDYVIVLAWLFLIGESIPSDIAVRHGGGIHMWNIQLQEFFQILYWLNIGFILYGFTIFFVRLSILLQYLRIFVPFREVNMFIFIGVHICIWSNFFLYLIDTIFQIAMCTPREKIWNKLITSGFCFNQDASIQASAVFNVFSDFAVLILPMPCVWKLHMPLKKKVLMTMIFATGLFACVSSILRTYYTWRIAGSADISYNIVPNGMWANAELSTGVLISCLPVIPKFFRHMWPKVSRALSIMSKFRKDSGIASNPAVPADEVQGNLKLQLPSFKHTFASIFSHTQKQDDQELQSYQTQAEGNYAVIPEETAMAIHGATRELSQMPPSRLATMRDDLENGNLRT